MRSAVVAPSPLNGGWTPRYGAIVAGVARSTENAGLAVTAQDFLAGKCEAPQLHEAFTRATVYCQAAERPGFVATGEQDRGWVPVFSSLSELARYAVARDQPDMGWFSTTGADVLDLLPEGYGLVLDPLSEHCLTLPAPDDCPDLVIRARCS